MVSVDQTSITWWYDTQKKQAYTMKLFIMRMGCAPALLLLATVAGLFVPAEAVRAPSTKSCSLEYNVDLAGPNLFEPGLYNVTSAGACCDLCHQHTNCSGFTWMNSDPPYNDYCSLKAAGATHSSSAAMGHISGTRSMTPAPTPARTDAMGVFMKSSWASEVPLAQLEAWFGLVAKGRADGPGSPYYVSSLGIQQVASGGPGHDFPAGTPAGTLYTKELALLSKYFHLFDTVYVIFEAETCLLGVFPPADPTSVCPPTVCACVCARALTRLCSWYHGRYIGTATTNYSRNCRGDACTKFAQLQTQIAQDFLKLCVGRELCWLV